MVRLQFGTIVPTLVLLAACGTEPEHRNPVPLEKNAPTTSPVTSSVPAREAVGAKPAYDGNFEKATDSGLVGWAWDPTQPDEPISVDIYEGPTKVATVVADQFRADLHDAGKGNGKHGFLLPFPPQLQDGKEHTLSIRPTGDDAALGPARTVKSPEKK
jgi:hypothetical protein